MGHYVLGVDGEPVKVDDLMVWAEWFESANRQVASDSVGDVIVSTVFLGLDHNWNNGGDPVLWETMIFGGSHDGYCDRYSSRAEALAGHASALAMALNAKTRKIDLD